MSGGGFSDWEDDPDGEEDDLWFLPGPDDEDEAVLPGEAPLPRANRQLLFDPKEWRSAQDGLSTELARLAQIFGGCRHLNCVTKEKS